MELKECIMRICYNMLLMCGIPRSICRELKQIEREVYGAGLLHPGMECFIAQINKLLTHYSSSSGLGVHMQVSMEMLIIESGVSTQILSEPFAWYGIWVTQSWLQSV
jgi:hypothetical protein